MSEGGKRLNKKERRSQVHPKVKIFCIFHRWKKVRQRRITDICHRLISLFYPRSNEEIYSIPFYFILCRILL